MFFRCSGRIVVREIPLPVGNGAVLNSIDASEPSSTILGKVSGFDAIRSIAISTDRSLAALSDWCSRVRLADVSNGATSQGCVVEERFD